MAWGTGTARGSGQSKAGATSFEINPSSAVPVGEVLVVIVSKDNTSTVNGDNSEVTSVRARTAADGGGTVLLDLTKGVEFTNSQGAAAGGSTVSIWFGKVTTQIETTHFIRAEFSASTAAKMLTTASFTIGASNTPTGKGSNSAEGDATTTPTVTLSGQGVGELLWIGGVAVEGPNGDTYTEDADFTGVTLAKNGTTGGGAVTNQWGVGESDVASVDSQTFNPTLGNARDCAIALLTLEETAPVAAQFDFAPAPEGTLALLGVGR